MSENMPALSIHGGSKTIVHTVAIFCISLVFIYLTMDLAIPVFDEGIILTGSQVVSHGGVPHRDFYANYGPAQFYILGSLFKILSPTFLVARLYDGIVRAAIVATAFGVTVRRCSPILSGVATVLCGLWMTATAFHEYPIFPVLLLSLWNVQLLAPSNGAPVRKPQVFAAGALTGLSALFRYDTALYVLIANLVGLAICSRWRRETLRLDAIEFLRTCVLYGLGTALVFVPPAAALLWQGAGPGFIRDMWFQAVNDVPMRGLPFPKFGDLLAAPSEAAIYLPFLALFLTAACILRPLPSLRASPPRAAPDNRFIVIIGLMAASLMLKGFLRPTAIHMMLAIIPSILLCLTLLERSTELGRVWRLILLVAVTLATMTSVVAATQRFSAIASEPAGTFLVSSIRRTEPATGGQKFPLPQITGAYVPDKYRCVAELISMTSTAKDRILVVPGHNDQFFVNSVSIYFESNRLPGTHWFQYDPGVQTRKDIQLEMISELRTGNVPLIVRDPSDDDILEPNKSSISSGNMYLDEYISQNYAEYFDFDDISVFISKKHLLGNFDRNRLSAGCRKLANKQS